MKSTERNAAAADRFGANLRRHRRAAGFTQADLAKHTGLDRSAISLIELGQREPKVQTIVKLKSALGVSADELLDGIDWQPPRGPAPVAGAIIVGNGGSARAGAALFEE